QKAVFRHQPCNPLLRDKLFEKPRDDRAEDDEWHRLVEDRGEDLDEVFDVLLQHEDGPGPGGSVCITSARRGRVRERLWHCPAGRSPRQGTAPNAADVPAAISTQLRRKRRSR